MIGSATNGVWGNDPIGGGADIYCIRATDFDRTRQRVRIENAPQRNVDHRTLIQHRLRPGDLILEKSGGGEKQPVGMVAMFDSHEIVAVCSNFCSRLAPASGIESRYLVYSLAAAYFQGLTQSAIKQTTGIQNLDTGALFSAPWAYPRIEEQRRIAGFLDAETARIDQLGAYLNSFERDVRERDRAVLCELLNNQGVIAGGPLAPNWRWTPLMHLTDQLRQIMYGIVLPGPNVEDGVPIVKGGDVAASRLSPTLLSRTTREIESGYARSRLKGGDLVIAIRGSVGEVAVVPGELTGANLTQDAARISIGPHADPTWLRLVLESPNVVHQIQQRVTGATIKGINIWDLKRILIPTPSRSRQTALAAAASQALEKHGALRIHVAKHRKLIAERRQALITAAVTGQIDVSTASGRGIED
ncbi:hypothetical protein [Phytohabitans rumicis]